MPVVPHLPPGAFGFLHAGEEFWIVDDDPTTVRKYILRHAVKAIWTYMHMYRCLPQWYRNRRLRQFDCPIH